MSFKKKIRQIHYWISPIIIIPIIIMVSSGIMLQLKKQSNWIQPNVEVTSSSKPVMLQSYLDAVSTVKEANISSWEDIERIDIRPDKGIAKIKSKNNWEIQIDIQTSEIYAINYRRSDIIESIHDGSFFSEIVKYGWFLPSGILLLTLSLTGIYMFFIPIFKKRKKNK
ncbi:MAG: PepSY domain-containing protein [Candidatus Neomarinimicrobiota bacterium]